jgi:hypothetical protein
MNNMTMSGGKMNRLLIRLLSLSAVVLAPVAVWSATDPFGKVDTIYAETAKVDSSLWTITIAYTNDEPVVGFSVPLKYSAGNNRLIADSAIYAGGRVEQFAYRGFRVDTAIQCVTLGMIANLGPTHNRLEPGAGRLVTIYLSSIDDKPIVKLTVDTTTTHPNNSLLVMTDSVIGTPPDTVKVEFNKRSIIPAFVTRQAKR